MKTIQICTQTGHSLNKITGDIVDHVSRDFNILTNEDKKWWKSDILLQHYLTKLKPFMRHKRKFLIQPMDGTVLAPKHADDINQYDEIITPSNLNKKYLELNGITKPIHVIPNYYDQHVEDNGYYDSLINTKKYTFYSETTGIERKNVKNIIRHFVSEFSHEDNVRLILKLSGDNTADIRRTVDIITSMKNITKNYICSPEIIIIDDFLSELDMRSLMMNIDCYVCLSYMEGFCIPLLNAAVLQKDIIALDSKISGYTDFIDSDNAYVLAPKTIPIKTDPGSMLIYSEESVWEEPDYNEYKKSLRQVFNGEYSFNKNKDYTDYHIDNVMQRYIDVLGNNVVPPEPTPEKITLSGLVKKFAFGEFMLPNDVGCNWLVSESLYNWEIWWPDILENNLNSNSNILDIGAHIGFTAVRFAEYVPDGHIYSFEPNNESFQYLTENLKINGVSNVTTYQCAIGETERDVGMNNHENLFENGVDDDNPVKDTKLISLDSIDLPKIDLIKIDTEGYEINVIMGARNLILRDMPALVVEIHHVNYEETESLLRSMGYNSFDRIYDPNAVNADYLVKRI